jgi:hypothetical protein
MAGGRREPRRCADRSAVDGPPPVPIRPGRVSSLNHEIAGDRARVSVEGRNLDLLEGFHHTFADLRLREILVEVRDTPHASPGLDRDSDPPGAARRTHPATGGGLGGGSFELPCGQLDVKGTRSPRRRFDRVARCGLPRRNGGRRWARRCYRNRSRRTHGAHGGRSRRCSRGRSRCGCTRRSRCGRGGRSRCGCGGRSRCGCRGRSCRAGFGRAGVASGHGGLARRRRDVHSHRRGDDGRFDGCRHRRHARLNRGCPLHIRGRAQLGR